MITNNKHINPIENKNIFRLEYILKTNTEVKKNNNPPRKKIATLRPVIILKIFDKFIKNVNYLYLKEY